MKERQSSKQFETILNSIADGVFTIDKNKNVTSFNKAAERITGVSGKQAIGQKCFDVFHSSICQSACALEKTLETGKETIDLRVNIINSAGERVPISVSTAVLRDAGGKITGGVETFRDLSAIEEMRKVIEGNYSFHDIISKNHEIQKIFALLPDIATSDSTVLIEGPSGSGKELFARAIHNLSNRKRGPYIVVNCGALPDSLLESELFGYVKGAFTDAVRDKPGRFARAEKGTLFLDEIGDLSVALQVKLLRVLQNGEYEPLGATQSKRANVRIVAATNKNLKELMERGSFRNDLYYRLNVVTLKLPPLSRRREDIPLLVEHFIRHFNMKMQKEIIGVTPEAMDALMRAEYPGNIRELENTIEHAFVLCRGARITPEHLPGCVSTEKPFAGNARRNSVGAGPLEQAEATAIMEALDRHGGHRGKTARELGIDVSTLWRKMKKLRMLQNG